jgi:hypothetical protein
MIVYMERGKEPKRKRGINREFYSTSKEEREGEERK